MDTNNAIKINDNDNVVVALRNITAGEEIFGVKAWEPHLWEQTMQDAGS